MKNSKYENSVFPYSLNSTVNLPVWRPYKLYVKIDEVCEELLTFCDVTIKTRTFLFVTSSRNMNLASKVNNCLIMNKNYTQIFLIFMF